MLTSLQHFKNTELSQQRDEKEKRCVLLNGAQRQTCSKIFLNLSPAEHPYTFLWVWTFHNNEIQTNEEKKKQSQSYATELITEPSLKLMCDNIIIVRQHHNCAALRHPYFQMSPIFQNQILVSFLDEKCETFFVNTK